MDEIFLRFVKACRSEVGVGIGLIFERQDGGKFVAVFEREDARCLLEEVDYALRASEPPAKNELIRFDLPRRSKGARAS